MDAYFTAVAACDMDALSRLLYSTEGITQEQLEAEREYVEGYEDITCYSLDGLIDALEASKAEIFTGRYTGTGTFGTDARSFLSFSKRPTIVLLFCPTEPSINMAVLPWVSGNPVDLYATGGTYLSITWQGNTVYWWTYRSAIEQFNNSGTAYYYVAL